MTIDKEFVNDRQKFSISMQILDDLSNYYFFKEDVKITYDLIEQHKEIKYFINTTAPYLTNRFYEYIHTWPGKPSPVSDCIYGLIIESWGEHKWFNIDMYRYTDTDNDEKLKPF